MSTERQTGSALLRLRGEYDGLRTSVLRGQSDVRERNMCSLHRDRDADQYGNEHGDRDPDGYRDRHSDGYRDRHSDGFLYSNRRIVRFRESRRMLFTSVRKRPLLPLRELCLLLRQSWLGFGASGLDRVSRMGAKPLPAHSLFV